MTSFLDISTLRTWLLVEHGTKFSLGIINNLCFLPPRSSWRWAAWWRCSAGEAVAPWSARSRRKGSRKTPRWGRYLVEEEEEGGSEGGGGETGRWGNKDRRNGGGRTDWMKERRKTNSHTHFHRGEEVKYWAGLWRRLIERWDNLLVVGEFVPRGCVRPAVMDARLRVSEGKLQFLPLILPAALSSIRLSCSQRLCRVRPHLKTSRVCPCLPVLEDRCHVLVNLVQIRFHSMIDFPFHFLFLLHSQSIGTSNVLYSQRTLGHPNVSVWDLISWTIVRGGFWSTCDLILSPTLKDRLLNKKKKKPQQLFLI